MSGISQEWTAIIVGGVVLFTAIAVLLVMKKLLGSVDGATFVAVLFVPLLVYALVSGRLAELSGPGGWGAKFRAAATAEVDKSNIIENAEALQVVEKGGLRVLRDAVENLNPDLPNALTLRVGRSGFYVPEAITRYLKTLMAVGSSTYVVFVDDKTGRFVGSANGTQVLALLETDATKDQFMQDLEFGGPSAFEDSGFLVKQALRPDDSNKVALQKFLDTNAEALVVVSGDGREPTGIVDKSRLLTQLMVKLAGDE